MVVKLLKGFQDVNIWYSPRTHPAPIQVDNHKGAQWVALGLAEKVADSPDPVEEDEEDGEEETEEGSRGSLSVGSAQNAREVLGIGTTSPAVTHEMVENAMAKPRVKRKK